VSAPGSRNIVSREDVDTAQALIDAWKGSEPEATQLPLLRGLITQALADAKAQGYDQGVQRGRQLIAHTVRDALENEGL